MLQSKKKIDPSRLVLVAGLLAAVLMVSGCGGGDAEELTTESAQAALTSQEVTEVLAPLYQLHGESASQLPVTFDKSALGETELSALISGVQGLLDKAAPGRCAQAVKVDSRSYEVTFAGCAYGAGGGLQVDGAVTLAWEIDVASKSVTISTGFSSFSINERQVDGVMKSTFHAGADRDALDVELDLVLTGEAGEQRAVALSGTIDNSVKEGQVTLDGSGTVSLSGVTYAVTLEGVATSYGERAPHAGSVTLTSGPLTVQVIFSEQTVSDGLVTLVVNGRDLGLWSWQDVIDFLS